MAASKKCNGGVQKLTRYTDSWPPGAEPTQTGTQRTHRDTGDDDAAINSGDRVGRGGKTDAMVRFVCLLALLAKSDGKAWQRSLLRSPGTNLQVYAGRN